MLKFNQEIRGARDALALPGSSLARAAGLLVIIALALRSATPIGAEEPEPVALPEVEMQWVEVATRAVEFSTTVAGPISLQAPEHLDPRDPGKLWSRPASGLDPLSKMGGATALVLGRGFDGASDLVTNIRLPDVNIAVGSESDGGFVVQAIHSRLLVSDRQGSTNAARMSFQALFGDPGVVDPRLIYDPYGERYVLVGFRTIFSPSPRSSTLYIAVSQDADPTGTWLTTSLAAPPGLHFDLPDVGFDPQGIYLSANLLTYSFSLQRIFFGFVQRPDASTGGLFSPIRTVTMSLSANGDGWTMRAVRQQGLDSGTASGGSAMFIGTRVTNSSSLRLVKFLDPFATQPFRMESNVPIAAFSPPIIDVPQPSAPCFSGPIDVLSAQLLNAEWRDGSIWTAHAVAQGGVNVVEWFEVQTWPRAPTFWARALQQGVITPNGMDQHAFSPAIAVNEEGEVAVVFTVSGPNDPPGMWATGRSACDDADLMAPIVEIRRGVSCIDTMQTQPMDPNRWGDYLGIVSIPDGDVFWATGQYATREGSTSRWNTHIQEFEIKDQCPGCSCVATTSEPALGTHP